MAQISNALITNLLSGSINGGVKKTSGGIGTSGPLSLGGGGVSGGGSGLFSTATSLGAFASASRKSTTGFAGGTSYFSPATQMAINNLLGAGDLAASLEQLNALITAALNKSSSSDWNLNGLPAYGVASAWSAPAVTPSSSDTTFATSGIYKTYGRSGFIYVEKFDGKNWVEATPGSASGRGIDKGFESVLPQITTNASGNPVVAYVEHTSSEIKVREWNGSSWNELKNPADSGSPYIGHVIDAIMDMGKDASGNPIIAWRTGGDYAGVTHDIHVKRWDGTQWAELGAGSATGGGISNQGNVSKNVSITTDESGNPVVSWMAGGTAYTKKFADNAWADVTLEPAPKAPMEIMPTPTPDPAPAPTPSPSPAPSPDPVFILPFMPATPAPAPEPIITLPVEPITPAPAPAPAPSPGSILDDPGIKAMVKSLKDHPGDTPYFSGTTLLGMDDTILSTQVRTYEASDGRLHALLLASDYGYGYGTSHSADKSFTLDVNLESGAAFVGPRDSNLEAIAAPTLNITTPSGSTATLHDVFDKSTNKIDQVEINGAATDAAGVVKWAKDNNLKVKDYSNGSNTIREYWADVKTDYGTKQEIVAAEVNGTAMNKRQYESSQGAGFSYDASRERSLNIHISDAAGAVYNIFSRAQPLNGGAMEYIVNGNSMTSNDFVNMAKSGNFEKRTFAADGHTVEEYWGKQDMGGGATRDVRLAALVDGAPNAEFLNTNDFSRSIKDASGNAYEFAQVHYTAGGKAISATEINGVAMTDAQLLDWAKTKNFETRNYTVNGHDITEYWDSSSDAVIAGDTKKRIAASVDGAPAMDNSFANYFMTTTEVRGADFQLWTNQREIVNQAGERFRLDQADSGSYWSGRNTAGVFVDNKRMDAQQLVNWAKDNNFRAITMNVDGHAITEYHSDNNHPYLSNVIAAEVDGKAYYSVRYNNSFEAITKTGNPVQIKEIDYSDQTGTGTVATVVDDKWMTNAQQLVDWSKLNVDSRTANLNGHTITEYYSKSKYVGYPNTVVSAEIDGKAIFSYDYAQNPVGIHTTSSLEVVNKTGERFRFNETAYKNQPATGDNVGAFIGDKWMNAQETVDWAKENNLNTRTGTVNGHSVTEYFARDVTSDIARSIRVGGLVVAGEIDGKAYLHSEYRQNPNAFPDSGGYSSPVALDLGGEGFKTVGAEQGVNFDLTGSGEAVQTGWVAGDTALLALDRNNNGTIDSGKELFGDQYGAANGYDELAKFDDNKDNVINASDAVFSNLRLWRDSNTDGVSGAGELVSLKDAGVSSLSLNYKQSPDTDAFGNKFAQRSTFTRSDGALGQSADIWFKFMSTTAYMKQQFNYNG